MGIEHRDAEGELLARYEYELDGVGNRVRVTETLRLPADVTGGVVAAREWTPYGEEVGTAQAGLGYTGEWWDADVGLVYLRARWYAAGVGIFTAPDPFPGLQTQPLSLHPYLYVLANPLGREVTGPITVDSGWHWFAASIIRGYGKRIGGPAIIATTVVFSSRMEATFVFYERGTRIGIRDWYNTRSFFWVQPWLGTLSLNRGVEVVTTLGGHYGPYALGEVQGAEEGEGVLPYTLRYLPIFRPLSVGVSPATEPVP